jgi:hypothetical protein
MLHKRKIKVKGKSEADARAASLLPLNFLLVPGL